MRWIAAGILVGALVGCSSETPPPTGGSVPVADVSGTWSYSADSLNGHGSTCSVALTFTLVQQGASVSGLYNNGTIHCVGPNGEIQDESNVTGSVVNVVVGLSTVSFDLDASFFHQTGTVQGGNMSGTATITLDPTGQGNVTLEGNWSAVRH